MRRTVATFALCTSAAVALAEPVRVGSLKDVEGQLLGELFAQTLEAEGIAVERRLGLGGTGILLTALASGDVDVVVQYSSTVARNLLQRNDLRDFDALAAAAAASGYVMSPALGFNNTYGIGVTAETAQTHGLATIADLRGRPWRGGVSVEFAESEFGLTGMAKAYGLTLGQAQPMEHALSYVALESGAVDFVDVYTTDASIAHHKLVVLTDALGYFPAYEGVALARADFATKEPIAWRALGSLAGTLDDATMQRLNRELEIDGRSAAAIVSDWRKSRGFATNAISQPSSRWRELWRLTLEHLWLVITSVGCALFVALPLGIGAARRPRIARIVLGLASAVQTVPGIAMLCFFIPWLGIGWWPAWLALTLYALLPILQGVVTGLATISESIRDSCAALGMSRGQMLRKAELPLALPHIVAGLRVATVTTIGTAALAAWVGAGGYGTWIAQGLALNQWPLVLWGAVPSALVALIAHVTIGFWERHAT